MNHLGFHRRPARGLNILPADNRIPDPPGGDRGLGDRDKPSYAHLSDRTTHLSMHRKQGLGGLPAALHKSASPLASSAPAAMAT
jgi:hypothetical protein